MNYLSGVLSADHFLQCGFNLLMADLMDYFTIQLWTKELVTKLARPSCTTCGSMSQLSASLLVCSR